MDNNGRPILCKSVQASSTKSAMHKAIQQKNLSELKRIVKLFNFDPNEELSAEGQLWTCIH